MPTDEYVKYGGAIEKESLKEYMDNVNTSIEDAHALKWIPFEC